LPLLTVEELTKDFGGLRAVNRVDMKIRAGEIVGLVGPNGAGKTTIFNVICGTYKPTSGRVFFEDTEITGRLPHQIARTGIARTFQLTNLFPGVTVMDNILFGLHRSVEAPLWLGFLEAVFGIGAFVRKEKAAREKAMEILEFLGLHRSCDSIAENLPHIDQRKLEIAIALAMEPTLLLLDEPAEGMQMEEAQHLADTLRALRDRGITILIVDHNMRFIMGVCDHMVVLHHGAKIAEGEPGEIAANEDVRAVYLG
jgi:branched-chain amino acid transport system ATP-binding protein